MTNREECVKRILIAISKMDEYELNFSATIKRFGMIPIMQKELLSQICNNSKIEKNT